MTIASNYSKIVLLACLAGCEGQETDSWDTLHGGGKA